MDKILIVDDFKTQRMFLQSLCSQIGVESIIAENGFEALEILKKEKISLVITDSEMPKMDGLALIKEIRSTVQFWKVPIVMVSSNTTSKSKALELGANEFLLKPFNRNDVLASISKWTGSHQKKQKIYNVLLIDDIELQTAIWEKVLQMEFVKFERVHSAQEGLNALRANVYDLIITDYTMPKVDGERLVNKLKSMNEFMRIPIIMITSNFDIVGNKPNGVDYIFSKPFQAHEVKAAIKKLVGWI